MPSEQLMPLPRAQHTRCPFLLRGLKGAHLDIDSSAAKLHAVLREKEAQPITLLLWKLELRL